MSQARGFGDVLELLEPDAGAQTDFLHEILCVVTPPREPQRRTIEGREVRLH